MPMTVGTINLETLAEGVIGLQLDRPPVNALNPTFLAEMHRVLEELTADDAVRAVVLSGAGKTLSGGMDLKELLDFTDAHLCGERPSHCGWTVLHSHQRLLRGQ
jgi:enoyl-CoA hydratase/carnithine racemase